MSKKTEQAIIDAIPTNWLDPLLTGPKKVIGNPPYGCPDIERLLNAIRTRACAAHTKSLKGKR